MSSEHTPGRLEQEHRKGSDGMWRTEIFSSEHGGVAAVCDWAPMPAVNSVTGSFRAGNARRLVACWNACERIPTDLLEQHAGVVPAMVPYWQLQEQRDELLTALKLCRNVMAGGRGLWDAGKAADSAIAKAEASTKGATS